MTQTRISGVIAALPTPFDYHGDIDDAAFIEHARWCLDNGCDFLNVLGTTGEANSLSATQRSALMMTAARELDGSRLMVGTGTPDLETTVALTRRAFDLGFAAALVLPPYYYKPVEEDGLFAWFAELVARTAETPIAIYLYNFPQLTGIEFSPALSARLSQAFPKRILGAKDSSGNLAYARELAKIAGFGVFPSSEAALADAGRDGYAGCISATVNIDPPSSQQLWHDQENAQLRDQVRRLRQNIAAHPLIPGVKYLVGKRSGNPVWTRVLPPQLPITDRKRLDSLDALRLVAVVDA
ncbi:dihydrodipicolinate synthase family protein [Rhizobium sp. P28RR-XV]|uniref:dihydrodipicolinate synthase family protein n=1 Tax=Rhizobium sp. P28RR-XV TaxID=2726737 RepID=UPI00145793AF|nr:dihydrodipicolinate synthase family protein [Rhizobium sp. P28RR-XV]NLR86347.1 dihydrodipicolinate synthase family protein [Rhizobium sp. P28RR-XV]